jgi:hypothetical protein
MQPTKFVITHKGNLKSKYGKAFTKVQTLLKDLAAADKKRGLQTRILYIDDATSAKAAGVKAVAGTLPKDFKRAVDAVYKKHAPDYIALFGAQDVVPFQRLANIAQHDNDRDADIPSDLPYACDAPYGTDVEAFLGPSRVVGRIPDIPGIGDPAYLTTVIQNLIDHKPRTDEDYRAYFAVSADEWKASTRSSLQAVFGSSKSLLLSPKMAPPKGYLKDKFKPLVHFYNCHGSLGETRFFGQKGEKNFPVALDAANLTNNIASGTIAAAECCYGAELIDPTDSGDGKTMSIANSYLGHKALAFVGSSTIAYGPAVGQGLADLITQYFVAGVMAGASAGRAMLEARQKFLTVSGPHLDPFELKTIGQFYLLGDPSVVAVQDPAMKAASLGNTVRNKRIGLRTKGLNLQRTVAAARLVTTNDYSAADDVVMAASNSTSARGTARAKAARNHSISMGSVSNEVKKLLRDKGFVQADANAVFEVGTPLDTADMVNGMKALGNSGIVRFRTYARPATAEVPSASSADGAHAAVVNLDRVLVVKEDDGGVLRWREYVSK